MSDVAGSYLLQMKQLELILHDSNDAGNLWKTTTVLREVFQGTPVELILCPKDDKLPSDVSVVISIKESDFSVLNEDQFQILLPLKNSIRMDIYSDRIRLNESLQIKKSSRVIIDKLGNDMNVTGIVRYVGKLPGTNGRQYGIELDSQFAGKGTHDGEFKKKRFFQCDRDCAVFYNVSKIRLIKLETNISSPVALDKVDQSGSLDSQTKRQALDNKKQPMDTPLTLGERIVWMSDSGPEYGTVMWIGCLPDSKTSALTVGVEFDNPIGSGTGRYKSEKLFEAKRHHASLVPLMGLMKLSDFVSPECKPTDDIETDSEFQIRLKEDLYSFSPKESFKMESTASPRSLGIAQISRDPPIGTEKKKTPGNVGSKAETRQSLVLKGCVMPPSLALDFVDFFCGKTKGISGQTETCCLESVIFAMFSFHPFFDSDLYNVMKQNLTGEVKKLLAEQIVNPLRATNYVSVDKVKRFSELLSMLEASNEINFNDPLSAIQYILQHLLGSQPSILVFTSQQRRQEYFLEIPSGTAVNASTFQQSLDDHFHQNRLLLSTPSSVLIIGVNRGKHYGNLIPDALLNVEGVGCRVCKKSWPELVQCKDCIDCDNSEPSASHFYGVYCIRCYEKFHSYRDRNKHKFVIITEAEQNDSMKPPEVRQMELFAMISSMPDGHFVTYIKSGLGDGSTWLKYDGKCETGESEIKHIPPLADVLAGNRSVIQPSVETVVAGLKVCFYRSIN